MLRHVRGPSILHVGCGGTIRPSAKDWLHGALSRRFDLVVGLDKDEKAVAAMRALGYRIIHGDAEEFDVGQQFDSIVAGEVIEHLAAPASFLSCAARHLKPGGSIVLTTPYPFCIKNMVYAFLRYPKTVANAEHTMWFCPRTMTELARRCDLAVTNLEPVEDYTVFETPWTYNFMVRTMGGLRWVIPARLRCNSMLFVLVPRAA